MSDDAGMTRRSLLAKAGAAGVGLGLTLADASWPSRPAWAQDSRRTVGANDTVVLGLIGCGGMGSANMHSLMDKKGVAVAALCDVDAGRMTGDIKAVTDKYGRKPDVYKDYRRILDRRDIDAVIIGTPDHWHALNLIHACEAGKDSYCEKPLSHDITEANAMAAAVRRFGRIVQVGTWQRSTGEFVSAVEFVRAGKLGRVTTVRAWKTDDARAGRHKPAPVPAALDYNLWTGPAPLRPYVPEHTHFQWRWFLENGNGMTGDWGVHMMDIGLLGMSKDTDLVMPVDVAAYGGKMAYPDDDRTWPDTHYALMRFPDFVMHWQTGRDHPGRPDQGTEFVGADGRSVMAWRGGWKVMDADGKELPKEDTPVPTDHWQNWLDCLKTRQQPRSNLASMAQSTIVCHLANAALFAGETVRWDKSKMDIVGKAGKNTISYHREYRKPYKLPIYKA